MGRVIGAVAVRLDCCGPPADRVRAGRPRADRALRRRGRGRARRRALAAPPDALPARDAAAARAGTARLAGASSSSPDRNDVGIASLNYPVLDNLDLAWLGALIHPDARRRGFGTAAYEELVGACRRHGPDQARYGRLGPRAHPRVRGGSRMGAEVRRRQPATAPARAGAGPGATGCTRSRWRTPATTSWSASRAGAPPSCSSELAVATAAINDAPLDDLDIEDEVFTADRVAAYENAELASGHRFYRVIVRAPRQRRASPA